MTQFGDVIIDRLQICSECFSVYGPWGFTPGTREGFPAGSRNAYWQKCLHRPPPEDVYQEPSASGTESRCAFLCKGCGLTLVPYHERWTVLFCPQCREDVEAFDRQHGELIIPVGLHSVVNGSISKPLWNELVLRMDELNERDRLEGWLEANKRMFRGIDRLEEWGAIIVRENCRRVGLLVKSQMLDPSLEEYLAAVGRKNLRREEAVKKMLRFFSS